MVNLGFQDFSYFSAIFPYFMGEAETYNFVSLFLFRAGVGLYQAHRRNNAKSTNGSIFTHPQGGVMDQP